ncbi:MAG: hypothetical protein JXR37_25750 [Kiritimatiellae bacterium]|nr:hypothetical protein [Kiritimatiellia bacterium]
MNTRSKPVNVTLMSFGFKYGLPAANYYFDVGFIKNPARLAKWDFFSGTTKAMRKYVLEQPQTQEFIERALPLLKFLATIDQHQVFAFGCNAGRHRSSIVAEEVHRRLKKEGIRSRVCHRDIGGPG